MLIDDVTITIKAGNGGNGAATFKRNAQTAKGGPDGGNGGNGGDIYIEPVTDLLGLRDFQFKKEVTAEDGVKGSKQKKHGRNGKDAIIKIPIGTRITDIETNQVWEVHEKSKRFLIANGGKGGRGNTEFKSSTNQTPTFAEDGIPGQERKLHLELLLIADIGLVGLPNAGKSSLLKTLTRANPKIGDYPFTTLEPNLGVMDNIVLADIPGLIEGASKGKGLGIKFLKHIEKTKFLLHCIDSSQKDLLNIYNVVRTELETYAEDIRNKPEIILLTKIDLISKEELQQKIQQLQNLKKQIIPVSIYHPEDTENLKKILLETFKNK
ncbi:MAG TPA: GTPase ObgE [Patescibacteria group bacterium]